jgi:hypothetical protein
MNFGTDYGADVAGSDSPSLLRLLSDVQALLAAQRRIEWKLTGLSKAQLAVNGTLDSVKQDVSHLRSQLGGGEPPEPVTPKSSVSKKSSSRTALAIKNMSRSKSMTASPKPMEPVQETPVPSNSNTPAQTSSRTRPQSLDIGEPAVSAQRNIDSQSPSKSQLVSSQEEVLRLRLPNGRLFTQLGRWKKTWGSARTTAECRLPGIETEVGELKGQALDRLLDVRLAPLAPGIKLEGTSEEALDNREFKRFGMKSTKSFQQTIFHAEMDVNFRVPKQCVVLPAGTFRSTKARGPVSVPEQDIVGTWEDGTVYLWSWLTVEEFEHFASSAGDSLLNQWMSTSTIDEDALQKTVSL